MREAVDRTQLITITKLDAARRQLGTAIELWFSGGDPVAIHSLIYAAHEIVHRLFRKSGHSDLLFDTTTIAETDRADFCRMLKADATFFKHANHDEEWDQAHEFHPGRNALFIVITLFGVTRIVDELSDVEWGAYMWFLVHQPNWMTEEARNDHGLIEALDELRGVPKREFLEQAKVLRETIRGCSA